MDVAERKGLGLALAGHLLLFAALSLSLLFHTPPKHLPPESMDVQLVGPVGLHAQLPKPSSEPPAESQATQAGPPQEATPPKPTPAPAPQPAPLPTPAPLPKPAPVPKPEPVPQPKPAPKPAPSKPAPPQPARLSDDFMKDIKASAAQEKKATGARLGPDFLKGITADKTGGKSSTPRATISGLQMRGLAAAIAAQVKPCYVIPSGGADAASIVTIMRLRFNRDGSVSGTPSVTDHQGVTGTNQSYVRQMDDAAIRAVLRCSPLKLPSELYEGGWEDIEFAFYPRAMG